MSIVDVSRIVAKAAFVPDAGSRNERVMENQGLVHQVARVFRGRGVALEDLIQFGNIGLMRAAEKFEPERGLRFSTYAVYWIRQAIYKGIANTSRPIRVPLHARKEAAAVHRYAKSMEVETGTKPWLTEVLDVMEARGDSAPAKRERLLRAAEADGAKFGVKPLEEVGGESRPKDSPLSVSIDGEHREQLGLALELLCEEHRRVLTWRYGLDGSPALAITATAALLGIGWRAAERMERGAIVELKKILRSRVSMQR
ncbi:MAG: sigma-70 family RNA polymerase sigma factor [Singulisphaera sp.]